MCRSKCSHAHIREIRVTHTQSVHIHREFRLSVIATQIVITHHSRQDDRRSHHNREHCIDTESRVYTQSAQCVHGDTRQAGYDNLSRSRE